MALRKIKIYSTNGISGTIDTNATTLGELKPLLMEREINFSGMKMLVGETRNELSQDEAVLPGDDFKLYLMPQKTKSGNDDRLAELYEEIADAHREIAEIMSDRVGHSSSRTFSPSVQAYKPSLSVEDAEAMADLRRLSGQAGGSNWD